MLASVLIIAVSVVLVVYWFRYTCILFLRTAEVEVQPDARFTFGAVREHLGSAAKLDPLHASLEKDYALMAYLLQNSGLRLDSIEERMLMWDYKMMRIWYRITRSSAPQQARRALSEMAGILSVLGGKLIERAGAQTEA